MKQDVILMLVDGHKKKKKQQLGGKSTVEKKKKIKNNGEKRQLRQEVKMSSFVSITQVFVASLFSLFLFSNLSLAFRENEVLM